MQSNSCPLPTLFISHVKSEKHQVSLKTLVLCHHTVLFSLIFLFLCFLKVLNLTLNGLTKVFKSLKFYLLKPAEIPHTHLTEYVMFKVHVHIWRMPEAEDGLRAHRSNSAFQIITDALSFLVIENKLIFQLHEGSRQHWGLGENIVSQTRVVEMTCPASDCLQWRSRTCVFLLISNTVTSRFFKTVCSVLKC